ncbi:MAG: hypothetical protein WKG07_48760 [Hymenobacter sp.]
MNGPVQLIGLHAGAALHGGQVHEGIGPLGGGSVAGGQQQSQKRKEPAGHGRWRGG